MGLLLSQDMQYSVTHIIERLVYMSSFTHYFTEMNLFTLNSAAL